MYIALALSVLVTVVVADKPFFPLPVLPRPRQPLPTCPNQGIDPLFGCENSRQCSSNFHCPLHSYCCEYGGCGDTRCQEAISPTDVVCYLPSDSGNCYAYFVRWYFNTFTGRCERFIYGGCGGNGNNFQTEQQCYDRCQTNQYLYPRGRGHTIYPIRRRSKY